MSKKIALFSLHSDPLARLGSRENGGQNLYIRSLTHHLDKIGWEVDVFTRLDSKEKKHTSRIGKRSRVIRLRGGPQEHIPKGNMHKFFPDLYKEFLRVSNPTEYVLFHGHHYDGGWMALQAHREFKKPFIQTFHSLGKIRRNTQNRFLGNSTEAQILAERTTIEDDIVTHACALLELADAEKRNLIEHYSASPEKVHVIPGGVDLSAFRHMEKTAARNLINITNGEFIVLYVGRMEWRKGISTLLHAFGIFAKKVPHSKLIIAGGKIFGRNINTDDYAEYERLRARAEFHRITDLTRFCGAVNHGDLRKFYSAADVLVVPSYYEPFGLVAIEGMASQVPVIASRVGGLANTITDGVTGMLFTPRDPHSLAEKLFELYAMHDRGKKISERALHEVQEHNSWKSIATQISELYNKHIHE